MNLISGINVSQLFASFNLSLLNKSELISLFSLTVEKNPTSFQAKLLDEGLFGLHYRNENTENSFSI